MLTARVLEKLISLTDENIETFYRALVEAAFNPTSSTAQLNKLQMLEHEYYSFLRNVLNPTTTNSIENKNRINYLLTQLRALQKEDFF